jgi:hypothetical protein
MPGLIWVKFNLVFEARAINSNREENRKKGICYLLPEPDRLQIHGFHVNCRVNAQRQTPEHIVMRAHRVVQRDRPIFPEFAPLNVKFRA